MLYIKYISCGPHGFKEEDFSSVSHYKSMGSIDPQSVASLDPRGINTKYIQALGLIDTEKKIFKFFLL